MLATQGEPPSQRSPSRRSPSRKKPTGPPPGAKPKNDRSRLYPTRKAFWLRLVFFVVFSLFLIGSWFYLFSLISEHDNGVRNMALFSVQAGTELLAVPLKERGCLWQLGHFLLRYFVDAPLLALGAEFDYLKFYHTLQLATGGLPAPHLDGYVVFSHNDVSSVLASTKQPRGRYISGLPVPSRCMGDDTLIFLSTGARHSYFRSMIIDVVRGFAVFTQSQAERKAIQWVGGAAPTPDLYASDDDIVSNLVGTLFYRMFGARLSDEQVRVVEQYLTYGVSCALGTAVEKLTAGYPTSKVADIRKATLQIVWESPIGSALRQRIEQDNAKDVPEEIRADPEPMVAQLTDGYLFAGLFGTSQLTISVLDRIRSNPALYVPMFRRDPVSFIIEQARLHPPVTSVTAILSEDVDIAVGEGHVGNRGQWAAGGQEVHFAKGTPVELALTTANRDPAVFGDTADEFDPTRSTLSQVLSWNGLEIDVAAGVAPRGCPGHWLAIDLTQSLVEFYTSAAEQNLTASGEPAPGDCYHAMACLSESARKKVIVYNRLFSAPSWYDVLFATLWITQCFYIMIRKTKETPISAMWWYSLLSMIVLLVGFLLDIPLLVNISRLALSCCLSIISVLVISQNSLVSGLLLSGLQVAIFFVMATAVVGTDFALGTYFDENNFKYTSTYWYLSVLMLKIATLIMFPKVGLTKRFWLAFTLGLLSMPLSMVPGVGLLLATVSGCLYLLLMGWVIGALSFRCPRGVTVTTLLFTLSKDTRSLLRKVTVSLLLAAALYGAFSFWSFSNGNICGLNDPQSDPLCTTSKVAHLDFYTRFLYRTIREDVESEIKGGIPSASTVYIPVRRIKLPAIEALPLPLYLPNEDEDMMHLSTFAKILESVTNQFLQSPIAFPLHDLHFHYDSVQEGIDTLRLASGPFADEVPTDVDSRTDEIISRWGFYGIGAHLVRRVPPRSLQSIELPDAQDVFVIDLLWMNALEVRDPFERYGAAAYFGEDLAVRRIVVFKNEEPFNVYPGDPEWIHAKFVWRSSLFTGITLKDHLAETHLKYSNIVVQSLREALNPAHPIRRLLTPFSYGTIEINRGAASYLCPELGILHRATGLSIKGLYDGFRMALNAPYVRRLDPLIADNLTFIPFVHDSIDYQGIVRRMVSAYLAVYYPTDDSLYQDKFLCAFTRQIISSGMNIPDIRTRTDLIETLTEFICTATSFHRHVGHVNEYVLDPSAAAGKIRPGQDVADVQTSIQILVIALLTSYPQPKILGDFSHLLLQDQHLPVTTKIWEEFQTELLDFSAEVGRRNTLRKYPVISVDPAVLLAGVSI